jgi:PhnB protein
MPKRLAIDELDQAIQAMLAGSGEMAGASLAPLLAVAQQLRGLPREEFRVRLKSDLERKVFMATTQTEPVAALRQSATARLRIKDTAAAIEFYQQAFGATEIMRFALGAEIAYAEIAVGNSVISLGEANPEQGYPGPESLGGSPMAMHLEVADADASFERAVAAGARIVSPVIDQFYGARSGQVADPFGYTWAIATQKENLSVDEMHRRFAEFQAGQESKKTVTRFIPEGFRTVTPYLVAENAVGLIDFLKQVFVADEKFRTTSPSGGIHCEMRLGDSMLMIGGGGPGFSWRGQAWRMAAHVYVPDTDTVYQRALQAGASSLQAPADQPWGERTANVQDPFGNNWYIATFQGENYFSPGAPTVQPYLHPLRAEPVIQFLKRAFGGNELGRYTSPAGVIQHTTLKIGNAALEMSEADGPYQPIPAMFYLYVPDVDATYQRALRSGGSSLSMPKDQSYGDRSAGVEDVFGNQWYIATHLSTQS